MTEKILEHFYNINCYIRPEVLAEANANPEKDFTIQGKDITRLAVQIEYLLKTMKTWQERAEYEARNYKLLLDTMITKEASIWPKK